MEIIFLVGGVQALFYSLLLFDKKNKILSDKILTAWMLILGIHLIYAWLVLEDSIIDILWLGGADSGLFTAQMVFLYVYSRALTNPKFKLTKRSLTYLLPTIVVYISSIPFYLLPYSQKIEFASNKESIKFIYILPIFFQILFYSIYLIKSLKVLSEHRKSIKNIFSFDKKVDLNWLKNLIACFVGLTIVLILLAFTLSFKQSDVLTVDKVFYLSLVFLTFIIGYQGYKQGKIFVYNTKTSSKPKKKIRTTISKQNVSEIEKNAKALLDLMEKQKPYLDAELTLYDLAKIAGLSSSELSTILNNILKNSFYDFINNYRVKEFKKEIQNPQKLQFTILAIAFDVGFNSKASFNRIFKNFTGKTPSEFKRESQS